MNGTRVPTDRDRAVHVLDEARQPLAAIMFDAEAALRWLRRESPDIGEATEALERIIAQGHRTAAATITATAMIRCLPPTARVVDVNGIILDLLEAAGPDLDRASIRVETGLSPALGTIRGDRDQLHAAVAALLANAVAVMSAIDGRQRCLTIRSRRHRRDGVAIIVADTGIAVAADGRSLSPEFGSRHGLDAIRTRVAESLQTIEAHGGTMWRTPNRPHGNVFTIALPQSPQQSIAGP